MSFLVVFFISLAVGSPVPISSSLLDLNLFDISVRANYTIESLRLPNVTTDYMLARFPSNVSDRFHDTYLESIQSVSHSDHGTPTLAFMLMCHDYPTLVGLQELLVVIYSAAHYYVIHVDSKVSNVFFDQFQDWLISSGFTGNIEFAPRMDLRWGEFSIVQAELEMLNMAHEWNVRNVGNQWDHVLNLCGHFFPVHSLGVIENRFASLGDLNVVFDKKGITKACAIQGWNDICERTDARCIDENCDSMDITPDNGVIYVGPQWVILHKEFVQEMIASEYLEAWTIFFRDHGIFATDELFFQTLLMNSRFSPTARMGVASFGNSPDSFRRIQFNYLYSKWDGCIDYPIHEGSRGSPCLLGLSDMADPIIYVFLFARKIASGSEVKTLIQREIIIPEMQLEICHTVAIEYLGYAAVNRRFVSEIELQRLFLSAFQNFTEQVYSVEEQRSWRSISGFEWNDGQVSYSLSSAHYDHSLNSQASRSGRTGNRLYIRVSRAGIPQKAIEVFSQNGDLLANMQLHVEYEDEQGIDAGGLRRDFMTNAGRALFNPMYGFFQEHNGYLLPSGSKEYEKDIYKILGKFIGYCALKGYLFQMNFAPLFYKYLTNEEITLEDYGMVDESIKNMLSMRNYSNDEFEAFDRIHFVAENPDGSIVTLGDDPERVVDAENLKEFIQLYAQFKVTDPIIDQLEQLYIGFHEVGANNRSSLPESSEELKNVIYGLEAIDPEMLFDGLLVELLSPRESCNETTEATVTQYFKDYITELSNEKRVQFWRFISSSGGIPSNPSWKLMICCNLETNRLPVAHTCSTALEMPPYESLELLTEKMNHALPQDSFLIG